MSIRRFTKPDAGKTICAMVEAGATYYTRGACGEGTLEKFEGEYIVTYRVRRYVRWKRKLALGWEQQKAFRQYWDAIGFLNRSCYRVSP